MLVSRIKLAVEAVDQGKASDGSSGNSVMMELRIGGWKLKKVGRGGIDLATMAWRCCEEGVTDGEVVDAVSNEQNG